MLTIQKLSYGKRLRNVSGQVPAGSILGVAGANGAGKSTLLRLLSRDIAINSNTAFNNTSFNNASGSWDYHGLSNKISNQQWATKRAWLAQRQSVMAGFTVNDIVLLGGYPHTTVSYTEQQALLSQVLNTFELQADSHRDMSTLSGGHQQRVHLARIALQLLLGQDHRKLQANERLVLLDEPLAGLDIRYQQLFLQWLQEHVKAQQWTVVLVLHELSRLLNVSDQLLLLKNGQQLAWDSVDKLFMPEFNSNYDSGVGSHSDFDRGYSPLLSECFDCQLAVERSATDGRWLVSDGMNL